MPIRLDPYILWISYRLYWSGSEFVVKVQGILAAIKSLLKCWPCIFHVFISIIFAVNFYARLIFVAHI